MLLAIDCGNTNIKFVLFEGDTLIAEWRTTTDKRRTADEYAVWLTQLMSLKGIQGSLVTDCIIATVVPDVLFNLRRLVQVYFEIEPLVVGEADCNLGITVKYNKPTDVGADRLADAIGAYSIWGGPLIVIDFGTATTFNVVDRNGDYLGGIIAPGVNLNLEALHAAAAKLPRVTVSKTDTVIGTDTPTAMRAGVYWGYLSLVEGLTLKLKQEYGSEMTVAATGGLAPLFAEGTKAIDHVDPHLTRRGLLEIWRRNRGPKAPLPHALDTRG
ncbi:MAG: type III pantothenate kinase [Alphaproteobacteria bacterium]|jgi:type III pantothenate kinase|nr:type III pantothenate kinase [Alphaproteobacteria bacterium]